MTRVVTGAHYVPINTTTNRHTKEKIPMMRRKPVRLSDIDPARNIPGAPGKELADKFRKIAKVLGVEEPLDTGKIAAAFNALLEQAEAGAPDAIESTALSLGLSKREAKMLAELRSDPRKYIELKAQRGYRPAARRR